MLDEYTKRLIELFVDDVLEGDLDNLVSFNLNTIKDHTLYGYAYGGAYCPEQARIVRAIMLAVFGDLWPNVTLDSFIQHEYSVERINFTTYIFGANIGDEYFKGLNKFQEKALKAGSTGKGLNYPSFKSKDELGKAYRAKVGNGDVKIPYMYWDIINNIKVGDIVVVFSSYKDKGKYLHKLYGWGHITSDCIFRMDEDNPIQREVEWHKPQPSEPVIEDRTKNTLYLHKIVGPDAVNIYNLLGITDGKNIPSIKPNGRFWLAGYNREFI